MILSNSRTLIEDIEVAKNEGFTEDFMYLNKNILGRNNNKKYNNEDCFLVEYSRHEGFNDPSDASILFLIECKDGTKGCLSSAYGKDANHNLIAFVMLLSKKQLE